MERHSWLTIMPATTGLLAGGIQALLRSSPTPTLFAVASSFQWFALGSTFWATRSTLLHIAYPDAQPSDRLAASSYAGGVTGGLVGGVLRGRRNVIPGTLMFTLFGFLGQTMYNRLDVRHTEQIALETKITEDGRKQRDRGFWGRIAEMKWSPMKSLSDEDYETILRERLLRVDADIALLDEKMDRLKEEGQKQSVENVSETDNKGKKGSS